MNIKNKKLKETINIFSDLLYSIDNSEIINNDNLKITENKIIYGKEGSGKSTYIMNNILHDTDNKNIVYISPSTKQSIEKFQTFKKLTKEKNKTNSINVHNIVSQSEICRFLISSKNEKILDILKGKQESLIELNIYNIDNNKKIVERDFLFNNCKSLTIHIDNIKKQFFNTNEIITKLLSYFSTSIKNKNFKSNIIIPIKIYKNENYKEKTNFGKEHENKLLLFENDINKYIDHLVFDPNNLNTEIYDLTNKLDTKEIYRGDKLYVIYVSNRCLKYYNKIIDNNFKSIDNIFKNNYNKNKKHVYFMEYFNFYNKIIEPILNKIIKRLDILNKNINNLCSDIIESELNEINNNIKFLNNYKIISDELPINISNLITIDSIIDDNKYSNPTYKKIENENLINLYSDKRKSRFKSKPYLNIEKLNKYTNLFKKLEELFEKNKYNMQTTETFKYIQNIYLKKNLNYLFTMFDKNITIITSEILPTFILKLYGFKVYNIFNNNDEKINEKIKANIYILKNPQIRIQKSNKEFVNNYINLLKCGLERKDKQLFIGQKSFDTDITIQSLKGSNSVININNKRLYDGINVLISPNPPDIGFIGKILLEDALQYSLKYEKNKENIKQMKKIKNRIKNDKKIIYELFSHIKYADDINQSLGRILGRRSIIFKNILNDNFNVNCFLPIVLENNDINLTQLTLNRVKTRFNKQIDIIFNEDLILNNVETLNQLKKELDYKLINSNKMLEISLLSEKFNNYHTMCKQQYGLEISEEDFKKSELYEKIKTILYNFKSFKLFNYKKTLYIYELMKKLNVLFFIHNSENVNGEKNTFYNYKINSLSKKLSDLRKKYLNNDTELEKKDILTFLNKNNNTISKFNKEIKDYLVEDFISEFENIPQKILLEKRKNTLVENILSIRLIMFITLLEIEFSESLSDNKEVYDLIESVKRFLNEKYHFPKNLKYMIMFLIKKHILFKPYTFIENIGITKDLSDEDEYDNLNLTNIVKNIEKNYLEINEIKQKKSGKNSFNILHSVYDTKYDEKIIDSYLTTESSKKYDLSPRESFEQSILLNMNISNILDKNRFRIEKEESDNNINYLEYLIDPYNKIINQSFRNLYFKNKYKYELNNFELFNTYIFKYKYDDLIFDIYNKYTKTPYFSNTIKLSEKDIILNNKLNNKLKINFTNVNLTDEKIQNRYDSKIKAIKCIDKKYYIDINDKKKKQIINQIKSKDIKKIEKLKLKLLKEINNPQDEKNEILKMINYNDISSNNNIIKILLDNDYMLNNNSIYDPSNNVVIECMKKEKINNKFYFDNFYELNVLSNTLESRLFNYLTNRTINNIEYYSTKEERDKGIFRNTENYVKNIKSTFTSLSIFNETNRTLLNIF